MRLCTLAYCELQLEKTCLRGLTRSDTNQAVQPQKMARGLKLVEGLYYLCSENKGADQLRVTAQLICAFIFAYAKIRFSLDTAQVS